MHFKHNYANLFFNSSIEVELSKAIHFIHLLEIYRKRVHTLFGNIEEKKSRGKYSQILLVIEVRSFFQFVGVIGK